MISGSLDSILKSFNCLIKKSYFPYSFVNQDNLYYIGDKPNKIYFKDIPEAYYQNIPNTNWDLKVETLNYLKFDLEGLLEALIKFNTTVFSKYQLNITSFKTLPGLALENNLDNIFGFVFGEITAPEAEVLRVPFIQYKDLIKRTEIYCPDELTLQVPFIQYRDLWVECQLVQEVNLNG